MTHSFKYKHDISYYMCDRNQKLTLSMLVNLLLDVSEKHSASLKREEAVIREMGYSWIILRYEFFINRMPDYKEEIEIETFATEYNKLFTYRDFIVRDTNGNELISVKTTFALMDSEKRKMARIPAEVVEPYEATFSKRIRRNPKPGEVDREEANEKTYTVRYFDIDANEHVNNSKYIVWHLDNLPTEFLTAHQLKHGIVTFDKEVKEKDTVTSVSSKETEPHTVTHHHILVGSTIHSTADFEWTKI